MTLVTPLLVMFVFASATGAGETADSEILLVDTEEGRVSGILEHSMKGREFYSFYSIPFAQPPLGKLRFKVNRFLTAAVQGSFTVW